MIKFLIFFIIVIIGFVIVTGANVTEEYQVVSKIRNEVLDDVIDPIVEKILVQAAESDLDETVIDYIEMNYPVEKKMRWEDKTWFKKHFFGSLL